MPKENVNQHESYHLERVRGRNGNIRQDLEYLDTHRFIAQVQPEVFQQITGRLPSNLARETAKVLFHVAQRASVPSKANHKTFKAVSAPTGAGKTLGTLALLKYLSDTKSNFSAALVIKTLAECNTVYKELRDLLGDDQVAIYTSLHKSNHSPSALQNFELEKGDTVDRFFTIEEFKAAPIVVTTHEKWLSELRGEKDWGVATHNGLPRLVIVDEEPELEKIYSAKASDVSLLIEFLSDSDYLNHTSDIDWEAEVIRIVNRVVPELKSIYTKMLDVQVEKEGDQLMESMRDVFTQDEVDAVLSLDTSRHVIKANEITSVCLSDYEVNRLIDTINFLQAAVTDRCFVSRYGGSTFYAYSLTIPAQDHTIILDATADLNEMYAFSNNVEVISGITPDYSDVQLHYVRPPEQFRNKMRREGILGRATRAKPYLEWLREFVVSNTEEGEEVLIYAKDRLLKFDLHKDPDDGIDSLYETVWSGRKVHFVNFGAGRGSNKWKNCTSYFRCGEFHLRKGDLLARIGSVTGRVYSDSELRKFNARTPKDSMYQAAKNSHLLINQKQDAARCCIRNFDDSGKAQAANLWMLDTDLNLLIESKDRLFPGVGDIVTHGVTDSKAKRGVSGPEKLRDLLMTTNDPILTGSEIFEKTGIRNTHIGRTLQSRTVAPIATARGWNKTTRKAVGLKGKGYVLTRAA